VKATFDGLVLPRKLPAAQGVVDARPAYEHAMRVARPALQKLYRDTFKKYGSMRWCSQPCRKWPCWRARGQQRQNGALIQNTDPGSNAGIPGLRCLRAWGVTAACPSGWNWMAPLAATAICWRWAAISRCWDDCNQ
jgi:mandelamide amidase